MTLKNYPLFLLLFLFGCSTTRHSVQTNTIIVTDDHKMGVQSPAGKLLIDTIYRGIWPFPDEMRKTLPPTEEMSRERPEFYLVRNEMDQQAIFDSNGKQVFDFVDCAQLVVDAHTETVVKTVQQADNRLRSYLYAFGGDLLFETSFEDVAYVSHSDFIALIAQDGATEAYYLYNPFTEVKLGPFTHFNIYNADTSPLLGMDAAHFEPYTALNIIFVRETRGREYVWGVIDLQGNELHPIAYKYFRVLDDNLRKRFIDPADKPEGVNFLFYAHLFGENSQMLLFDEEMSRYVLDSGAQQIIKLP